MKLSNKVLIGSFDILAKLYSMPLNVKVSYAVMKNVDKIQNELKTFYDARGVLIKKYAYKNDNGEPIVDSDNTTRIEQTDKFNSEQEELLNIENDIDIFQFDLDELLKCECNLSPSELKFISYMIKE